MKKLNFRIKILILTLLPLIVISSLMIGLVVRQMDQLGGHNVANFSDKFYELRRKEIKNYTNIAVTSLKHITTPENREDKESQEQVRQIIRDMAYGNNGYFFGYEKYTTQAHPNIQLEGANQENMTDPNGVMIIQELYNKARLGGGFSHYVWMKPSLNREVDKIGYAQNLDWWDWWIGTGLYVDDIEDTIAEIQDSVDQSISTSLQLILGTSGLAIIIVGIIGARMTLNEGKLADEQLQMLSHKAIEAQEEERRKVAYELQKNIAQSLYTVRSKLVHTSQSGTANNTEADQETTESLRLLDSTIQDLSRISGELHPVILEEKGLGEALKALTDDAGTRSEIQFSCKETGSLTRLRQDLESALYRIAKESIDNIIEHSKATKAEIRLNQSKSKLTLKIQDNGSGFDMTDTQRKTLSAGVGLNDMHARAQLLGGKLSVFSSKGAGTLIKVEVPV
ncbi:cache domain-containing protein [Hahella ganghwensis]|uniref:cache domain-containing protein n=1 Tax=Hahella ganghwensis TaxID=286420 RepID=UPI00037AD96E|nr:cache domain-containing protein [Hahella ganghwensis]